MRMSDWSSDVCASDLAVIGGASLATPCVIVFDFLLDEDAGLELVREPCSLGELGIDFAEIHLAEVEPGELVERETLALFFLGLVPRLGQLAEIGRASCRERGCQYG